jgi:transcriptional regulator with XRE-family HTH domain
MSGVSQSMLSQVEKLRRDPSPETIEKLAVATETPLSFFDVPASNIPDDSLHFRKNKTAPVKLTAQVKAYFREAHRVVSRILDKVGFPIAELPVAGSIQTDRSHT